MPRSGPHHARPGLARWLTVGVLSYGSWLLFNLLLAVVFPLFLLVGALAGRAGRAWLKRIVALLLRVFFIHYLSFIRVYRFAEIPDKKQLESAAAKVIIANHRSWLDAILVMALVPGAVLPVKTAYTRIPLVGRAMVWLGCVPMDRASRDSIATGIAQIRNALDRGETVAAFPEGRRAPDTRLRPFSDVFFRLAIETGAPVVPVLLHSDLPYLSPAKGTFLTARRANWRIRMLGEVYAREGEQGVDLGRRVRESMDRELRSLDSTGDER